MPILLVNSHHASPEKITGSGIEEGYHSGTPLKRPASVIYQMHEGDKLHTNAIVVASQDALEQILIRPEDDFRSYNYTTATVGFNYRTRKEEEWTDAEKKDFSAYDIDRQNPSRNFFGKAGGSIGGSSISLVQRGDVYEKCMIALMETLGELPIIPVLQAYVFDPKNFDTLAVKSEAGNDIPHEHLTANYPYGVLAYPKRIWPEFYSAITGNSILRVSHHPNRNNDPHYHAFRTDPRLGEIQDGATIESVVATLRENLMPLLEIALETEQRAFYERYPEVEQFDKK